MTRTRRSTEEVRTLVLAAARRLFSIHGFGGTSTRDVAAEAGVTAAAIYRHFESKSGLFEAAVSAPLHEAIAGFLQEWEFLGGTQRTNNGASVRLYLTAMVKLLRNNRELMVAYLHGHDHSELKESALSRELSSVVERVAPVLAGQGLSVDVPVAVRCVTGMVMSLVLYNDFLFPPHDHPSQDRILDEMVALIVWGIEGRDTPGQ